jgi:glutaredoxin
MFSSQGAGPANFFQPLPNTPQGGGGGGPPPPQSGSAAPPGGGGQQQQLEVIMYFTVKCPHCRKFLNTLQEFPKLIESFKFVDIAQIPRNQLPSFLKAVPALVINQNKLAMGPEAFEWLKAQTTRAFENIGAYGNQKIGASNDSVEFAFLPGQEEKGYSVSHTSVNNPPTPGSGHGGQQQQQGQQLQYDPTPPGSAPPQNMRQVPAELKPIDTRETNKLDGGSMDNLIASMQNDRLHTVKR